VQEASVAKKAFIVAGSCKIPLSAVANALDRLSILIDLESVMVPSVTDRFGFIRLILILRQEWPDPEQEQRDFGSLLNEFASCKSSDPRDHVYGFLGLASNPMTSIAPDYGLTTAAVYTNATRAIIEGTRKLDILEFVPRRSCSSNRANWLVSPAHEEFLENLPSHRRMAAAGEEFLPSWVPDWSEKHDTMSICRDRALFSKPLFDAAKGILHSVPNGQSASTHRNELVVKGEIVDRVYQVLFRPPRNKILGSPDWYGQVVSNAWLSEQNCNALWDIAHWDEGYTMKDLRRRLVVVSAAGQVHNLCNCCNDTQMLQELWRHPLRSHAVGDILDAVDAVKNEDNKKSYKDAGVSPQVIGDLGIHHAVILTQELSFALAPWQSDSESHSVQSGDHIAILHGSRVPIVLREVSEREGTYSVVGQCYLEDAMFGEMVSWAPDEAKTFILV
jgi:hypothetical protein